VPLLVSPVPDPLGLYITVLIIVFNVEPDPWLTAMVVGEAASVRTFAELPLLSKTQPSVPLALVALPNVRLVTEKELSICTVLVVFAVKPRLKVAVPGVPLPSATVAFVQLAGVLHVRPLVLLVQMPFCARPGKAGNDTSTAAKIICLYREKRPEAGETLV